MKTETLKPPPKPVFNPVVITLETREELIELAIQLYTEILWDLGPK